MNLKDRFPNASHAFLRANGLVAPRLSDPKPEPVAREKPLAPDQTKEKGSGRTLVCIERRGTRLLDSDNACGGIKPLLDALRYAGYISDDNPAAILLVVRQRKVPKADTGTFILVAPLTPE